MRFVSSYFSFADLIVPSFALYEAATASAACCALISPDAFFKLPIMIFCSLAESDNATTA